MPKKSRKKRNVTRPHNRSRVPPVTIINPESQNYVPTAVLTKPSSQNRVRAKDDFNDPARYAHFKSEIKMIGIIGGIILAGIFALYFILR